MSALAEHLAAYLALRRSPGYRLIDDGRELARFVAFLHERGEGTVTAALAWTSSRPSTVAQTTRRLSYIRRFAAYLAAFDADTEVPPTALLRGAPARTTPYLYAPGEVAALITAARRLRPPLRGATVATVIGLMAATGMRTGEVLALDRGDVDLPAVVLTVRDSKWHMSRLVPLHHSVAAALELVGEQVAVAVERHLDRRVAHPRHDRASSAAPGDQPRRARVPEVVVMPTSA